METLRADRLSQDRFERSRRIGWLDMEAVMEARILVVGCGAIGNEVCKNLVLSGARNITVIDMDRIEHSNLNRCLFFSDSDAESRGLKARVVAERMVAMDGNVDVTHYSDRIQDMPEDFIPSHDLVLGCLDNIAARLHVNAFCYRHGVPYIDGATRGFTGKVQVVRPPATPCLECTMNRTHMNVMNQRFSCTGRTVTFFEDRLPAEITTTSIISAVQVREALKLICGRDDGLGSNMFYYNGVNNTTETYEIDINPGCPHHG